MRSRALKTQTAIQNLDNESESSCTINGRAGSDRISCRSKAKESGKNYATSQTIHLDQMLVALINPLGKNDTLNTFVKKATFKITTNVKLATGCYKLPVGRLKQMPQGFGMRF